MTELKQKNSSREAFVQFLKERGLRRTPERFAVVDKVLSMNDHFYVESLREAMEADGYRVSRATLYNTIELLLDCKLVTKHQFGTTNAHYERAYDNHFHEHLICQKCGKVEEFEEPHIAELVATLQEKYNFTVNHHLLYVYGLCDACRGKGEEA